MAGDWIKIEHSLPTKPEVSALSDALGISEDEVVGKLVRLWVWTDQHSRDGHAVSVTETTLDRRAGHEGFAAALRKVGWLDGLDTALEFPNFSRHNGQSSKSRALAKDRKKLSRFCHAASVTEAGPEKRREEKSISVSLALARPTLDQARNSANQCGVTETEAEDWWMTRDASNWMKGTGGGGTTPVGGWQSDMKKYTNDERNRKAEKSNANARRTHRTDDLNKSGRYS